MKLIDSVQSFALYLVMIGVTLVLLGTMAGGIAAIIEYMIIKP